MVPGKAETILIWRDRPYENHGEDAHLLSGGLGGRAAVRCSRRDAPERAGERVFDVVIYGGTAAAVTAAVQARKMGKSVVVVSPDKHLGGMTSGAWDSPIRAIPPPSAAWRGSSTTASGGTTRTTPSGNGRSAKSTATGAGNRGDGRLRPDDVDFRAARRRAGLRHLDLRKRRHGRPRRVARPKRGVAKEGSRIVSIASLDAGPGAAACSSMPRMKGI